MDVLVLVACFSTGSRSDIQCREFGIQVRREIATVRYPGREMGQMGDLSREKWCRTQGDVSYKFRELLIAAFPETHMLLNAIYLQQKSD